jgi:hypothetical protein
LKLVAEPCVVLLLVGLPFEFAPFPTKPFIKKNKVSEEGKGKEIEQTGFVLFVRVKLFSKLEGKLILV